MNIIVAVDKNWGIGFKGQLLERIPDDMKNVRKLTTNKVIVMGRKTLESFPGKRPLKDRINVVLTKNVEYLCDDCVICHSIKELLDTLKVYNKDDIFVFGGEQIYKLLLPYCNKAYVTKIDKAHEADAYMTNLDKLENWTIKSESQWREYSNFNYQFVIYENSNVETIN